MSDKESPIQEPNPSEPPKKSAGDDEVLLDKQPFDIPAENMVVPRGTRIRRTLWEKASQASFRFYNDQSEYLEISHPQNSEVIDIPMPSNTPLGRNAAVWRYRGWNGGYSDWYNSGYYYVAKGPEFTYPAGTRPTIHDRTAFSGTGDVGFNATVQLRRTSDNANLSGWITVQSNGTWIMPMSFPIGVYDVYLAGSGQDWQIESRSANINLTVNWTPTVTTPANNTAIQSSSGFTITGKASPNAKVNLHITEHNVVALGIDVNSNGDWSTFVNNRTNMILQFITQQYSGTYYTPHSAVHTVYLVGKPIITRPQDGIVSNDKPTITGTGCPSARIQIVEADVASAILGEGEVSPNGSWSVLITSALPQRPINLTCRQTLRNVTSVWADSHQFSVLSAPVVTDPGVVDVLPALTGTHFTGVPGIQVDIYRDLSDEKIGQGVTGANGAWSANITTPLVPGVPRVTALLRFYSHASTRSAPVSLTVRPGPPVVNEVYYPGTTTALKGTGFPGATIEIHPNSGSPNATALVNPEGYFETTPITLNPGTTGSTWGARQKIANGSAWIFSAYHPIPPVFNVPTPVPTVNAPTLIGQIPSVTGRGSIWQGLAAAKIEVVLKGATDIALDQATVTATGDWTATTTTAVPPGSYTVSVRQLMNGVYSLPITAPASLDIKPLPPTVDSVEVEDFSPRIKGTCWPGAILSLTYTGGTTHSVTSSNGKWEFRRDIKFKPGEHSFSVTQSFGGQVSVATGPEKFKVETPEPEITSPVNQQETDFRPEIKGKNGYVGATVAVFDNKVAGPELGSTTVESSDGWTVVLDKELTEGGHDIYARQTFETQASERSASVLFNAKVPEPSFDISAPAHYPRRSKFFGSGLPGAQVILTIDGEIQPGAFTVDANGKWEAEVYLPQVGNKMLVVTQKYAGGERSSPSYAFTTVTNAPLIESPSGGESVDPDEVVVSGHGFPGDTVVVRESGAGQGDNIGQYRVNDDGFWSGPVKKLDGKSDYKYWAYSTQGVIGGDASETAVVQLQTLERPVIEYPSHSDVLVSRLVFSGLGLPGAKIQVADLFNPETKLAPETTVNEFGKWSVEGNTDFSAGPHWVIVQQSLGEETSPWVRSGRFIIEEPPSGFMAPTLDAPLPGAQVGLEPMLAGRGVPGALVYVRDNGKELLQTWVDALGRWKARLPAFALGKQTLTVVQARYGVWSAPLSPEPTVEVIQVTDNFAAPTVESPASGSTVDMRFWVTGSGMAGAKVNVYKTNDGQTVYASAIVDAFGHWRACMSRDVPIGSFSFTAQQLLDGKASHYFAPNTIVTVAEQLPVPAFDNAPAGAQIAPVTRIHGTGFPGAKVVLHKSGDAATIWGEAKVDDEGYWVIWTNYLPLGLFTMTAKQVKGTLTSAWMPQRAFTVVNAG